MYIIIMSSIMPIKANSDTLKSLDLEKKFNFI